MRRILLGLTLAAAVTMSWTTAVLTQSVNCGGSFVPSLNCTISGLWNFTNPSVLGPFQVGGTTASGVISQITDLSNADVLALGTALKTVVPAPPSGYAVDVVAVTITFNYVAAYTNISGHNLRLYYGNRNSGNAASSSIIALGLLDATATTTVHVLGNPENSPEKAATAIVIQNDGVAPTGGDPGNSVRVAVNYRLVKQSGVPG